MRNRFLGQVGRASSRADVGLWLLSIRRLAGTLAPPAIEKSFLASSFSLVRFNALTLLTLLTLLLRPAALCAQPPAREEGPSRFSAVDIYVDSKSAPLAAYQIEFFATNGIARIVGIEGGDSPAFHEPPIYDPKAIQHERVIIAAFSTSSTDKLPAGKTRIATIHLQIVGDAAPRFQLNLQVAANPEGNRISADASFEERKSE